MILLGTIFHTFCLLFLGGPVTHDLHLCKTDIRYKPAQQAIQITIHSFIDDTEAALKLREDLPYKFFESTEHPATDSILMTYYEEHLNIKVNGAPAAMSLLGKEQSDDIQGVYSYIEIYEVTELSSLEISNTILMDLFSDQRNILSVMQDDDRKAFHIFNGEDHSATVAF